MGGSASESDADAQGLVIRIDPTACRAAGECVFRAPGSFELRDDHKAHYIEGSTDGADAIVTAARSCPNFAISVKRGGRELA